MTELAFTEWPIIATAVAAALVAGLVRGFTGFGGPAIMMLVLTQFFSPASVLVKVLLMDFVAVLPLLPGVRKSIDWRTSAPLIIGSIIGMPLGVVLLVGLDPVMLKRGIAAVTGVCTAIMLTGWRYRREPRVPVHLAVGLLGGAVVGATFIALPVMIYLFAGPALVAVSRANALVWGPLVSLAMMVVLVYTGTLVIADLAPAAVLAAAYMSAAYVGSRVFYKVSEQLFRRVVLWVLLVLSVVGILT